MRDGMNTEKEYDIIGIGNPLLDIIIEVEEAVLLMHGLKKGEMHLVDSAQSQSILESLEEHTKTYISGGSAGNTVTGATLLGARGLFLGVIGDDLHGDAYEEEMQRGGVITNLLRHEGAETGCAITFVTPDGGRLLPAWVPPNIWGSTTFPRRIYEKARFFISKATFWKMYLPGRQ